MKRSTFHVLSMYANELEQRVGRLHLESPTLALAQESLSLVDALATTDEEGRRWVLALINRHPTREVKCALRWDDGPIAGTYPARVLAGDSADAFNDVQHPNRVVPERRDLVLTNSSVRLAPHSLTFLQVQR